ncbi:MAG: tetrahydromethanopterin S-methyltransferase subunit B [Candidatus Nezhaarchaeales archaeon]
MLSTIIISPEFDIILDPENMVIGEARSDLALLDVTPIDKKIGELNDIIDVLFWSFDPKVSTSTTPRSGKRGLPLKVYYLPDMILGFLVGLALFSLIIAMHFTLTL